MTDLRLERAGGEMRCPTCNAQQAWADECRRCKCDLSLVRKWRDAGESERRRCLHQLQGGRTVKALRHAQNYARIVGAYEASRLLAVCNLLCHNWAEALAAIRRED
jgi:hypothetical protein